MQPEPLEDDTRKEFLVILAAFRRFLSVYEDSAESWEVMEEIITLRASFLIDRALTGLRIDFDKALDLLRNHNTFVSEKERQQRDVLVAAIDNLVDFAVAEEMEMLGTLPTGHTLEDMEECLLVCQRYNETFARRENDDVLYAARIAAWWLNIPDENWITFMTQGDERVRAWHLSQEGLTYRKSEFPPELIPPLEWGCRCYLVSDGFSSVTASLPGKGTAHPVHPVFRESLATGGHIFSGAHPYFKTALRPEAEAIRQRIKTKFHL